MNFTALLLIVVIFFSIVLAGVNPLNLFSQYDTSTLGASTQPIATPVPSACTNDNTGVLILIPTDSQMTSSRLTSLQVSLSQFISSLNDNTAVSIDSYDAQTIVQQDFTLLSSNRATVTTNLNSITTATTSSPDMNKAMLTSSQLITAAQTAHAVDDPTRKYYVILIADTIPANASENPNATGYVDQIKSAGTTISTIEYQGSDLALDSLLATTASNPSFVFTSNGDDISSALTALEPMICN